MKSPGTRIKARIAALAVALLWAVTVQGQSDRQLQSFRELADRYWQHDQFAEAAKYYRKVVLLSPGDLEATYQLAECNRRLFRYESAEAGYGKVHYADAAAYPEALFYYAAMQKLNGKYIYAVSNFEKFLNQVHAAPPAQWPDKSFWMGRATVEKDGCHFALLREKFAQRDFNFALLPPPASTAGNDYAPVIFAHDTSLLVTSGRVLDSARMGDTRLGEAFSDFYAFQKGGNGWDAARQNDLPGVINTRWNEGTGCFNRDKTRFYYTNCSEPDAACRLYVTTFRAGKWDKPQRLNRHVNLPGADTRQPALSGSGDTLFFVSNRPGGTGNNDIWMSVTAGDENWSPAVNLGKAINTPFNELSPFVNPADGKLLFASDGHLGLGGLDIYAAAGGFNANAEVTNLGPPFNSNRDDCFLVMGDRRGYLASNRAGGPGGFDLYTFDNFSRRAVIAGVGQKDKKTPDFYYLQEFNLEYLSDEDKLSLDRVSSRQEAAKVYRQEVSLTEEDLGFYERLSQEERDRLERLVAFNIRRQGGEEAIRAEDQAFYRELSPEEKARIHRFAAAYRKATLNRQKLVLDQEDTFYYQALDSDGKRLLDRVVASRLGEITENGDSSVLAEETFAYRKLPVARAASPGRDPGTGMNHSGAPFREDDPYKYDKLSAEERNRLAITGRGHTAAGRATNDASAFEADHFQYEKLSDADKDRIDRMAAARKSAQLTGADERFSEEDQFYYASLDADDRNRLDRTINGRIARQAPGTDHSALAEEEYSFQKMPGEAGGKLEGAKADRKGHPLPAYDPQWGDENGGRKSSVALHTFEPGQYQRFTVRGRLRNAATKRPAAGLTIPLVNEKGEVIKTTSTNPDGSFSYVNLSVPENYRLVLQTPPVRVDEPGEYYVEDLEITAYAEVTANVQFEPVFFGFNAFALEADAAKTLDALATWWKRRPGVQIELDAFTDGVGADRYNLELSRKRGEAVRQYLLQQGVAPGALVTNARGKRVPGAPAGKENGNASDRRVELTLKGAPEVGQAPGETLMISPRTDVRQIAEKVGVPAAQLKEMNGLTADRVAPYRPLKVKRP